MLIFRRIRLLSLHCTSIYVRFLCKSLKESFFPEISGTELKFWPRFIDYCPGILSISSNTTISWPFKINAINLAQI